MKEERKRKGGCVWDQREGWEECGRGERWGGDCIYMIKGSKERNSKGN